MTLGLPEPIATQTDAQAPTKFANGQLPIQLLELEDAVAMHNPNVPDKTTICAQELSAQEQPTIAFGLELKHLVLAVVHQPIKTALLGLPEQTATSTNAQPPTKFASGQSLIKQLELEDAVAMHNPNVPDKTSTCAQELSAQEQPTIASGPEPKPLVLAVVHQATKTALLGLPDQSATLTNA